MSRKIAWLDLLRQEALLGGPGPLPLKSSEVFWETVRNKGICRTEDGRCRLRQLFKVHCQMLGPAVLPAPSSILFRGKLARWTKSLNYSSPSKILNEMSEVDGYLAVRLEPALEA